MDTWKHLLLIADDDHLLHRALDRYAHQAGLEVAHAMTGGEVVPLALRRQPSAILLDLGLPDRDGADVLAQLKATPELADIPVMSSPVDPSKSIGGSPFNSVPRTTSKNRSMPGGSSVASFARSTNEVANTCGPVGALGDGRSSIGRAGRRHENRHSPSRGGREQKSSAGPCAARLLQSLWPLGPGSTKPRAMARMVKCVKLGRELEGLDKAPARGRVGQRIFENVRRKPGGPGSSTRRCWSTSTVSI